MLGEVFVCWQKAPSRCAAFPQEWQWCYTWTIQGCAYLPTVICWNNSICTVLHQGTRYYTMNAKILSRGNFHVVIQGKNKLLGALGFLFAFSWSLNNLKTMSIHSDVQRVYTCIPLNHYLSHQRNQQCSLYSGSPSCWYNIIVSRNFSSYFWLATLHSYTLAMISL